MLKSKVILLFTFIVAAGLTITGCSISVPGRDFSVNIGSDHKEYSSGEVILDNITAESAEVSIGVGTISVDYNDTDTVEIDADFTASGNHEDTVSEALEHANVKAEVDGNVLQVSVVDKETDTDFWKWLDREYGSHDKPNLSADLDIKLPVSFRDFEISSDVGDINLDSLKGVFDISNNVGSIDISDITFTGDSRISADVGDISCSLNEDQKDTAEVSLVTDIGNIKLDMNGLEYSSDDRNEDDDDFLGASKEISIEDLLKVSTEISIGKVTLR